MVNHDLHSFFCFEICVTYGSFISDPVLWAQMVYNKIWCPLQKLANLVIIFNQSQPWLPISRPMVVQAEYFQVTRWMVEFSIVLPSWENWKSPTEFPRVFHTSKCRVKLSRQWSREDWKTGGSKCLLLLGFVVRRLDFVFLSIRAVTCRLTAYCMLTEHFHDPGCWKCPVILCTKTMAGAAGTCWMGIDGAHSPEMGTSDGIREVSWI